MIRKIVKGKLKWIKENKESNKKIKNATKIEVDGIKFRSKLEAYCYTQLKTNNIDCSYEDETFTLMNNFEFQGEKIRAITYTPDFTGKIFIIECKGFANDVWPLKSKLFKLHLKNSNDNRKFFTVKNQKEINECITQIKKEYEKVNNSNIDNSNLNFIYWS